MDDETLLARLAAVEAKLDALLAALRRWEPWLEVLTKRTPTLTAAMVRKLRG